MSDLFRAGLECFNAGDFFAAHEHWEDLWRETQGESRAFLQGLVQVAVGLHHYSTGNLVGARSVVARGLRNLEHTPAPPLGCDFAQFRADVAAWVAALQRREPTAVPRLEPAGPSGRIPPSTPSDGV